MSFRLRLPGIVQTLVALVVLQLAVTPRAHADDSIEGAPLLKGSYYELSPMYWQGGIPVGSGTTMKASGIHIYERNGLAGKFVATVIVATIMAMGQSNVKSQSSESHVEGDYLVTTTTTTYKTPEEQAADRAAAGAAIAGAAAHEYHSDLQIYVPEKTAKSTVGGFSYALYPWSYGKKSSFDFGFGWTMLSDHEGVGCSTTPTPPATCPTNMVTTAKRTYNFFGMPFRYITPISKFALVDIGVDWNWLAGFKNHDVNVSHATLFRAGITLNPHPQLFVRGEAVVRKTTNVGISLEAGVRF